MFSKEIFCIIKHGLSATVLSKQTSLMHHKPPKEILLRTKKQAKSSHICVDQHWKRSCLGLERRVRLLGSKKTSRTPRSKRSFTCAKVLISVRLLKTVGEGICLMHALLQKTTYFPEHPKWKFSYSHVLIWTTIHIPYEIIYRKIDVWCGRWVVYLMRTHTQKKNNWINFCLCCG